MLGPFSLFLPQNILKPNINTLFRPENVRMLSIFGDEGSMIPIVARDVPDNFTRTFMEFRRSTYGGWETLIRENMTSILWGLGIPAMRILYDRVVPQFFPNVPIPNLDPTMIENGLQQLNGAVVHQFGHETQKATLEKLLLLNRENIKGYVGNQNLLQQHLIEQPELRKLLGLADNLTPDGVKAAAQKFVQQFQTPKALESHLTELSKSALNGVADKMKRSSYVSNLFRFFISTVSIAVTIGFGLSMLNVWITKKRIANQNKLKQQAQGSTAIPQQLPTPGVQLGKQAGLPIKRGIFPGDPPSVFPPVSSPMVKSLAVKSSGLNMPTPSFPNGASFSSRFAPGVPISQQLKLEPKFQGQHGAESMAFGAGRNPKFGSAAMAIANPSNFIHDLSGFANFFMKNDRLNNLVFIDGSISGGRLAMSRKKEEFFETLFREGMIVFFLYEGQRVMQKMLKSMGESSLVGRFFPGSLNQIMTGTDMGFDSMSVLYKMLNAGNPKICHYNLEQQKQLFSQLEPFAHGKFKPNEMATELLAKLGTIPGGANPDEIRQAAELYFNRVAAREQQAFNWLEKLALNFKPSSKDKGLMLQVKKALSDWVSPQKQAVHNAADEALEALESKLLPNIRKYFSEIETHQATNFLLELAEGGKPGGMIPTLREKVKSKGFNLFKEAGPILGVDLTKAINTSQFIELAQSLEEMIKKSLNAGEGPLMSRIEKVLKSTMTRNYQYLFGSNFLSFVVLAFIVPVVQHQITRLLTGHDYFPGVDREQDRKALAF